MASLGDVRRSACAALLLLLLHPACGSSDCEVEQNVTIRQGVYGRVTYQSDVGNAGERPVAGEVVPIFDANGAAVASATTDADGVFQVELDAGSYFICRDGLVMREPYCKPFEVTAGRCVRFDLYTAFLGSEWSAVDPPCPIAARVLPHTRRLRRPS